MNLARTLGALVLLAPAAPAQFDWRPLPFLNARSSGHAMAWDPIRERVVLFGGRVWSVGGLSLDLSDTWEWDGRDWNPRTPLHRPPGKRWGARMAFDPVRKTVVLYGGADQTAKKIFGDMWEWDGQDWRQIQLTGVVPLPLWFHAMATEPNARGVLLFGGAAGWNLLGGPGQPTNQTWFWDGKRFVPLQPKTSPPPRLAHSMAYCARSRHIVTIGGGNGFGGVKKDTWEWSGRDWVLHPESKAGSPTWDAPSLAAEPKTGRVLGHGFLAPGRRLNETWAWDGTRWSNLRPPQVPALRTSGEIVRTRQQVLFFGGIPIRLVMGFGRDTWIWTGATWRKAADWIAPGSYYAVTHDTARDRFLSVGLGAKGSLETFEVVGGRWRPLSPRTSPFGLLAWHNGLGKVALFGGTRNQVPLNDLWLWDGTTWTRVPTKTAPPAVPTSGAGQLAYDSARDRLILVVALRWPSRLETWEWDGKDWMRQTGAQPPYRTSFAIAYDAARKRTVLFGGTRFANVNDLWEWDGRSWREVRTTLRPTARCEHLMAYDAALGGVVLAGGRRGALAHTDTWVWNGTQWQKLAVRALPSPTIPPIALAYDPGRQTLALFYHPAGALKPASTIWELAPSSLTATQPYPRPGQSLRFDARLPAFANRPFLLLFALRNRPGIPLRTVPGLGSELLPLAPDPLFFLSLQAPAVAGLDRAGKASFLFLIPNDSGWIGGAFYAAGLAFGSNGIGRITNDIRSEIVR